MKILHTSDWHLGRSIYGKKRYEEFSQFLKWLLKTINEKQIDALLIAGDVFDTSTPGNRAQELYYKFLCNVSTSCCRHVVVIAGNHDSPSFLNAPKELLRVLNVHVVGSITNSPEDEVIILKNDNKPEALICAVPYLRDKDIRIVEPGESIDDKNTKLVEGLKKHYQDVCSIAEKKQEEFKNQGYENIPIIAMGHLFTAGGKTVDGDGVRDLYVGSLAHINNDAFPKSIDYLALGHLHVPQKVGKAAHIRYSGSPIPMGFGEAGQDKKIIITKFSAKTPEIEELILPCFQELLRIKGNLEEIKKSIKDLKDSKSSAWLEIEYNGKEIVPNLREILDDAVSKSNMEIRRIKNNFIMDRVINNISNQETLDDLDPQDVFNRCLDAYEIKDEDRKELINSYGEIIKSLEEEDINAE